MAFASFREFLNALERTGEFKRISQPAATELEITELADREMKSPGGGKALLIGTEAQRNRAAFFPSRSTRFEAVKPNAGLSWPGKRQTGPRSKTTRPASSNSSSSSKRA